MEAVKTTVINAWNNIKAMVAPIMESVKATVVNAWETIKTKVSNAMNSLKTAVTTAWNNIKSAVVSTMDSMKSAVVNTWNKLVEMASTVGQKIKDALLKPIQAAKEAIGGIVDSIKGMFSNLDIKLPDIKLPHFSVQPPGWKMGDLLEGSVPKLGVDWYAKAMNNPMVMTEPTIFGYNAATGKLQGGGEAGSEVVSGTGTLMGMIGAAVEQKTGVMTEKMIAILSAILMAITDGNQELVNAILSGQIIALDGRELGRTVREYA
jgi:phage-related protein